MKFRQKIFLITFVFVTISIILIGIITINNNYKNSVDNRIEMNKSNIRSIVGMLKFYNVYELNSNFFNKDNTLYEISKDGAIIYTNLSTNKSEIRTLISPVSDRVKAMVYNKSLYMSAKIDSYEIILVEDIKEIYDERDEQVDFFIKVSIIFSFIIAISLYIVIYILTRRIDKLGRAVKRIQEGDYDTRVGKLGNDEIGNLANSFDQMAVAVNENIKEIEQVSENRKNFIHNITHEIRTPLTSIIGYSSLIKNGKVNDRETIIQYNDRIYEEGNYLNQISERLIDIVLLDNKRLELENVNISKQISKIVDNFRNEFKDVYFEEEIEDNVIIKSDEILLHSLVTNILKNAVMACDKRIMKDIKIRLEKRTLTIQDNGKGMTKEQIEKVTEPFYTLNKDRNRKISGMGLGLPLCLKISEVLNSELYIESKEDYGTTVTIIFNEKIERNASKGEEN